MNKSDLADRIQNIGKLESLEEIRAELGTFQSDLEKDYEDHDSILKERDSLKVDNENIRQANMKLFQQIGVKEPETKQKEENKLKYEDLFNEKGGLK